MFKAIMSETTVSTKTVIVALAGNPNVGKTSIFNALTGSHQHTGNWPGVTVEKKEGTYKFEGFTFTVIDLPGTYGLTAYSLDERIARDFLLFNKPDVVVVVVDSTNLERNLYLVLELLEMGQNVVVDLNMSDEARKFGLIIDPETLSKQLNVPVVQTVAPKKEGIEDLKKAILEASNRKTTVDLKYSPDFEEHLKKVEKTLKEVAPSLDLPLRWISIKLIEQDGVITEMIKEKIGNRFEKLRTEITSAIVNLERKYKDDIGVIITQLRFSVLHSIARKAVKKKATFQSRVSLTDKLDRIFTNRVLGIPIFLIAMWGTFQLTFSIGGIFADWVDSLFGLISESISKLLANFQAPDLLISLISDGVIGGVGSVLVFLPNIFLLFLAIAVLEDSGYMARAAFVMDKLMNAIGLPGKAFIPMILGFGCNVPAIMATRTIKSEKDRVITVMVNPLISCSARLPIYTLFATIFFPRNQGLVIFSIYVVGIVLAILMAKLFNKIIFKKETTPFIMELPPYRVPSFKNTFGEATRRSLIFLRKAGTIIFTAVLVLWVLASFPSGVEYASEKSIAGMMGKFIAPIFKPAGFGFWQAGVALIFGTMAKEVVVGTFGALFSAGNLATALKTIFTPLSAYSFMLFSLIYIPCIASIAAIKREIGWKWALFTVIYLPILAYIVSVGFYQIGSLILR